VKTIIIVSSIELIQKITLLRLVVDQFIQNFSDGELRRRSPYLSHGGIGDGNSPDSDFSSVSNSISEGG
tara:strand:+ start:329 stop:535 length:207 start_codon:yes stop_codon:yes gene_type:complete